MGNATLEKVSKEWIPRPSADDKKKFEENKVVFEPRYWDPELTVGKHAMVQVTLPPRWRIYKNYIGGDTEIGAIINKDFRCVASFVWNSTGGYGDEASIKWISNGKTLDKSRVRSLEDGTLVPSNESTGMWK